LRACIVIRSRTIDYALFRIARRNFLDILWAVSVINRFERGRNARNFVYIHIKVAGETKKAAATRLQKVYRGFVVKKERRHQIQAIMKLQKVIRGINGRVLFREVVVVQRLHEVAAIIAIQSCERGRKSRNFVKLVRKTIEELAAAIVLQAGERGRKGRTIVRVELERLRVELERMEREEEERVMKMEREEKERVENEASFVISRVLKERVLFKKVITWTQGKNCDSRRGKVGNLMHHCLLFELQWCFSFFVFPRK
jgi:myosin heavy subunit